jgi:hypothetical protein
MDEERLYDIRIFMRSGNVVEIDHVTEIEWEYSTDRWKIRVSQAEGAQARLLAQSLDFSQVEAIVSLERGPDEVG